MIMRKIEQDMLNAIEAGKNEWVSGNTRVHAIVGGMEVQLHGNIIATVEEYFTKPCLKTFRNWPTSTTVSRLRALGINASIKNFQPCIDGKEI
jgi:hypothetical protein